MHVCVVTHWTGSREGVHWIDSVMQISEAICNPLRMCPFQKHPLKIILIIYGVVGLEDIQGGSSIVSRIKRDDCQSCSEKQEGVTFFCKGFFCWFMLCFYFYKLLHYNVSPYYILSFRKTLFRKGVVSPCCFLGLGVYFVLKIRRRVVSLVLQH